MKPKEVLNSRNLKRTSCREGIISVMLSSQDALSENEIRNQLSGNYDRTTFYRSFKTLEEKQIIHKIVVDNQLVKYAIDNSISMKKEHAHFYCNHCQTVKCLETVYVNSLTLPDGYTNMETEVLIKGTCALCSQKSFEN